MGYNPPHDHYGKDMQKLLIVKMGETFSELRERRGDFEDWIIARLGVDSEKIAIVAPYRGDALPGTETFSGAAITGSHDMVSEKKDWSERTARWLPGVIAAGKPLLGICYGHQLIAHAMGGRAGPNPNGNEFGTADVHLTDAAFRDPLFAGLPSGLKAHVSHSESALELPPDAVLLAANDADPRHAFSLHGHVWGVQFHPEFDADITRAYLHYCEDMLTAEGQDVPALLDAVADAPHSETLLRRFGAMATP